MTQDQYLDNGHQATSSKYYSKNQVRNENTSKNSRLSDGINSVNKFNVDAYSKRSAFRRGLTNGGALVGQDRAVSTDISPTGKYSLANKKSSTAKLGNTSSTAADNLPSSASKRYSTSALDKSSLNHTQYLDGLAAAVTARRSVGITPDVFNNPKMTVVKTQKGDGCVRDNIKSRSSDSKTYSVNSRAKNLLQRDIVDKIPTFKTPMQRLPSERRRNRQDQPEDPIERLNKLRASISSALSEVKGVLKQYSAGQDDSQTNSDLKPDDKLEPDALIQTETEKKGKDAPQEAQPTQPAEPEESGPIRFRFVRKIRRTSVFSEDDGQSSIEQNEQDQGTSSNITGKETPDTNRRTGAEELNIPLVDGKKLLNAVEESEATSLSSDGMIDDKERCNGSEQLSTSGDSDARPLKTSEQSVPLASQNAPASQVEKNQANTVLIKIDEHIPPIESTSLSSEEQTGERIVELLSPAGQNKSLDLSQKQNDSNTSQAKTKRIKKNAQSSRRASLAAVEAKDDVNQNLTEVELKVQRRPSDSGTLVKQVVVKKYKSSEKVKAPITLRNKKREDRSNSSNLTTNECKQINNSSDSKENNQLIVIGEKCAASSSVKVPNSVIPIVENKVNDLNAPLSIDASSAEQLQTKESEVPKKSKGNTSFVKHLASVNDKINDNQGKLEKEKVTKIENEPSSSGIRTQSEDSITLNSKPHQKLVDQKLKNQSSTGQDIKPPASRTQDLKTESINNQVINVEIKGKRGKQPEDPQSTNIQDGSSQDSRALGLEIQNSKSDLKCQKVDLKTSNLKAYATVTSDLKDLKTLDIKTQDLKTPDLKTPDIKTQDLRTHDLKTQDLKTQNLKTQDLRTHDLKIQDQKTDILKNQGLQKTQHLNTQDFGSQVPKPCNLKSQDLKLEGLKTTELKSQDSKILNLKPQDVKTQNFKTEDVKSKNLKKLDVKTKGPESDNSVTQNLKTEDLSTQSLKSQGPQTSSLKRQDSKNHDLRTQNVKPQNLKTEDSTTQSLKSQGPQTSSLKRQDSKNHDLKTQNVKPQNLKTEDLTTQHSNTQELKTGELRSQGSIAQNLKPHDSKTENLKSRDLKSQDTKTRDLITEGLKIQGSITLDLVIQDSKYQDSKSQGLQAQDLKTQDLKTKDLKTQDLKTQDLKTQDLKTFGSKTPESQSQHIIPQGPKTQDIKAKASKTVIANARAQPLLTPEASNSNFPDSISPESPNSGTKSVESISKTAAGAGLYNHDIKAIDSTSFKILEATVQKPATQDIKPSVPIHELTKQDCNIPISKTSEANVLKIVDSKSQDLTSLKTKPQQSTTVAQDSTNQCPPSQCQIIPTTGTPISKPRAEQANSVQGKKTVGNQIAQVTYSPPPTNSLKTEEESSENRQTMHIEKVNAPVEAPHPHLSGAEAANTKTNQEKVPKTKEIPQSFENRKMGGKFVTTPLLKVKSSTTSNKVQHDVPKTVEKDVAPMTEKSKPSTDHNTVTPKNTVVKKSSLPNNSIQNKESEIKLSGNSGDIKPHKNASGKQSHLENKSVGKVKEDSKTSKTLGKPDGPNAATEKVAPKSNAVISNRLKDPQKPEITLAESSLESSQVRKTVASNGHQSNDSSQELGVNGFQKTELSSNSLNTSLKDNEHIISNEEVAGFQGRDKSSLSPVTLTNSLDSEISDSIAATENSEIQTDHSSIKGEEPPQVIEDPSSGPDLSLPEESPEKVNEPQKRKKKFKVKRKVIIRRVKRKLSKEETFLQSQDVVEPETEICEKDILESTSEDDADKEEDMPPAKQQKSILKPREYQIGDQVLFAERVKKTQIKWRKGVVIERITSISYKLDLEGEEKPAHVSYIKRFNDKKVNFGGKEYLEIDYEQIEEEEEKERNYSIWNLA